MQVLCLNLTLTKNANPTSNTPRSAQLPHNPLTRPCTSLPHTLSLTQQLLPQFIRFRPSLLPLVHPNRCDDRESCAS